LDFFFEAESFSKVFHFSFVDVPLVIMGHYGNQCGLVVELELG
jgi:hypothetical protein